MKTLFPLFLFFFVLTANAQTQEWEQTLRHLMAVEDDTEAGQWEETLELLGELARNPIDLNKATREDLEQLVFLSNQQTEQLQEYLDRYGPMKSLNELRLIPSLDPERLQLLACFVCLSDGKEQPPFPSLKELARNGRHEVLGTLRVPFYERRGDQNGYLGYPYRHWLRYDFSSGQRLHAGIIGAQDAGEPFFANKNKAGYDFYSYFLQLRGVGRLEQLIVGKYRLQSGMGLVLNTNFTLGKTAILSTLGRQSQTVRPHSSRTQDNYFQGAAATISLGKPLKLTLFGSYRQHDATLNAEDGSAATLVQGGYHRTPTEMAKKNNTSAINGGGKIMLKQNGFHVGATTVYTHLSRPLHPNTTPLYRRHYAHGTDFLNVGIDYGYTSHAFSCSGETAVNQDGAIATLNTASLQLGSTLSLIALQRFYAYRYTSLYAQSFCEGSGVQNESGFYAGATWQPMRRLRLQAYTDYAYFAWARYQVSASSHAWDNLLSATYTVKQWTLNARYRLHLRQRDRHADESATSAIATTNLLAPLEDHWEHRARLSAARQMGNGWSTATQADLAAVDGEAGWAAGQSLSFRAAKWQLHFSATYFDTPSYSTRLYTYERGPLYTFTFPVLNGQGVRGSLLFRADVTRRLMLLAKLSGTKYFDRHVIGTGYQQVFHSAMTDLDLQARWHF